MQKQRVFHRDERYSFTANLKPAPTPELRRWIVSPLNYTCPLSRLIGNDKAKKKLSRAAFNALGNYNHLCRDLSWLFTGPASAGKTTAARLFAETVMLPFVEVSPSAIKTVHSLVTEISRQMANQDLPLVEDRDKHYTLPPCVIFIDEVHALTSQVIGALLKAVEQKDGILASEKGIIVDCYNVCWIVATTEVGDLFGPFQTRFCEINLNLYNREEVSQIVKLNNKDWSDDVCALVAKYQRLPRKALEFAREMRLAHDMEPTRSWESIASEVATDNGIDKYGMHEKQLTILKLLKQKPIGKDRLPLMVGMTANELKNNILSDLLAETSDRAALVSVGAKGYQITDAGIKELELRGL